MGRKLYVGNMSYEVDSSELQTIFSAHGTVTSAEVIADRDTGRSKGFGSSRWARTKRPRRHRRAQWPAARRTGADRQRSQAEGKARRRRWRRRRRLRGQLAQRRQPY
jgi:hypothetical protein